MARRIKAHGDRDTHFKASPVTVVQTRDRSRMTELAWAQALSMAGGDITRLEYVRPGQVRIR